MTTATPRPYASHLEASEHHEDRLPDLCRRGLHPMEGDNTIRTTKGRQCRACKNEGQRRRYTADPEHADRRRERERQRYEADPEAKRQRHREWLARQALRRCRRGHVQTAEVEYVRPDGRRECRRCRRRYQREWRARRGSSERPSGGGFLGK